MVIWVIRSLLCSYSVYSYHLFLISSAPIRSILFLSFIMPIFAWNVPLVSLIFLKRSPVFPILLSSSIFLQWSPRKLSYLSLLFFWNSAFRWVYHSFPPLSFTSLLVSAICKAFSDNHFVFFFLIYFSFGLVLITSSYTMLHSSSGTVSTRWIPWIYLSLPLYNHKDLI